MGEAVERREAHGDEEDPEQPEQGQSERRIDGTVQCRQSTLRRVNDRPQVTRTRDRADMRVSHRTLPYHEGPVDPTRSPLRGMSYTQARRLLVAVGVGVLGVLALVMYARRVETVEVVAVLLFVPVFLALLRWDLAGGVAAAAGASVAYIAMRASAIDSGRREPLHRAHRRPLHRVSRLRRARGMGQQPTYGASLTKLDLYDQIDDLTGLFNARYFMQGTDFEMARARRYHTIFAVVVVDIPAAPLEQLARRAHVRLLRELGRLLGGSVREVDRVVHSRDDEHHRLAVILPETGPEGARCVLRATGRSGGGPRPARHRARRRCAAGDRAHLPRRRGRAGGAAPRVRHDRPRRAPGGVRADSRTVTWDERQRTLTTRLAGRPLSALEQGTLVVIPSTTFPSVELRKITGIEHYEERMLFTALLLRRPELRLVFVTAVPVEGAVTEYFLRHLPDPDDARRRLHLVSVGVPEPRALSEKLLARPDVLEEIRAERGRRVVGLRAAVQRDAARTSGERRVGSAGVRRVARAFRVGVEDGSRQVARRPASPPSTAPKGSARSTRWRARSPSCSSGNPKRVPSWSS